MRSSDLTALVMSRGEDFFAFDDPLVSPTNALFPDLSAQYDASNLNLHGGMDMFQQQAGASLQPYSASIPSLSPASQTASHNTLGSLSHSPRSTASPSSTFSLSGTDDLLLGSSFSSSELDMFLAQNLQQKPAQQPIFLPTQQPAYQQPAFTPQQMLALLGQAQQPQMQQVAPMMPYQPQASMSTMAPQWMQQGYQQPEQKPVVPQNRMSIICPISEFHLINVSAYGCQAACPARRCPAQAGQQAAEVRNGKRVTRGTDPWQAQQD